MTTDEPGLTLYGHPLASYCWKVLVALYETGTPFRNELIEGLPKEHPKLSALWPIAKMPVLHDAANGRTVPETTIIIDYLQAHYPGAVALIPEQSDAALEARLWDRFFDLYIQTPMQKLVSDRLRDADQRDPFGVTEAKAQFDTAYPMLEDRLGHQTWAAGNTFTMADCAAMPALFYASTVYPFRDSYPALQRYFERLTDRASVRRTIREAQPYFQFFPFHEALDPRFISPNL